MYTNTHIHTHTHNTHTDAHTHPQQTSYTPCSYINLNPSQLFVACSYVCGKSWPVAPEQGK